MSTLIFSEKAKFYHDSRPRYPKKVFEYILKITPSNSEVVEFGCGTGIFTQNLIELNYNVTAIEPCEEMLSFCKKVNCLSKTTRLIHSKAEDIVLEPDAIDAFFFPQSLHWIDIPKIKKVISAAGRNDFHIYTIWNSRARDYCKKHIELSKIINKFKDKFTNKIQINSDPTKLLKSLKDDKICKIYKTSHKHYLDFNGVINLFLSTSDVDLSLQHDESISDLNSWFEKYKSGNKVEIIYDCYLAII